LFCPAFLQDDGLQPDRSQLRRLPQGDPPTRRRGLTLIELVIGLAITAVVSAVLAILINATAVGTNSTQDGRRSLVKMQGVKAQLEDTIKNSSCVLAAGANYIVLWTGDLNGAPTPVNRAVNLSELRLIEVDTATGNLNIYAVQWPANFGNGSIVAADTTYSAATTWYTACSTAKAGGYFVPTTIATSVTGMTVSLDSATVTQGRLVSLVIAFTDAGTSSRSLMVGAGIRNLATPW
jgi:prepilin-type N-terminal cleavage/methylation domain-containing protein